VRVSLTLAPFVPLGAVIIVTKDRGRLVDNRSIGASSRIAQKTEKARHGNRTALIGAGRTGLPVPSASPRQQPTQSDPVEESPRARSVESGLVGAARARKARTHIRGLSVRARRVNGVVRVGIGRGERNRGQGRVSIVVLDAIFPPPNRIRKIVSDKRDYVNYVAYFPGM
jgi:hypothetical protein